MLAVKSSLFIAEIQRRIQVEVNSSTNSPWLVTILGTRKNLFFSRPELFLAVLFEHHDDETKYHLNLFDVSQKKFRLEIKETDNIYEEL